MIVCELTGSDTATAHNIAVRSNAPVLKLCRALLDAGHSPDEPLEAYRGGTLCLRVASIGAAACLAVNARGTDFYRPRGVRTAPYVRPPIKIEQRITATSTA